MVLNKNDVDHHSSANFKLKRTELMSFLLELSDPEIQIKLWLQHEDFPNSSGIDEVVHYLFDDTDLGTNPNSEIGRILYDANEALAVKSLSDAINNMVERLGDRSSNDYISDPGWKVVLDLAQAALNRLNKIEP